MNTGDGGAQPFFWLPPKIILPLDEGLPLEAETGLRGERQQAILSIVYAGKYPQIRDLALKIDPKAFIVAAEVKNVNGLGYTLTRSGEAIEA